MDDAGSVIPAATALEAIGGAVVVTSKLIYSVVTTLLSVIGQVLSFVLFPVILLGRFLMIIFLPFWLIASWTWHAFVVLPARFLAGFEMLYVFLATALIIGLTTGVVLRFSTSMIVSFLPESFGIDASYEEDEHEHEENERAELDMKREQERQESRLLEAFSRAEAVGRRREKERHSADMGRKSGSSEGRRKGDGESKASSKSPTAAAAASSGSGTGSGSNVLKQTILEEEESSAEWDS